VPDKPGRERGPGGGLISSDTSMTDTFLRIELWEHWTVEGHAGIVTLDIDTGRPRSDLGNVAPNASSAASNASATGRAPVVVAHSTKRDCGFVSHD
jgi:hypothetical protein